MTAQEYVQKALDATKTYLEKQEGNKFFSGSKYEYILRKKEDDSLVMKIQGGVDKETYAKILKSRELHELYPESEEYNIIYNEILEVQKKSEKEDPYEGIMQALLVGGINLSQYKQSWHA